MLIKDLVYVFYIWFLVLEIFLFIYSIKNKNKNNCNKIIFLNVLNMVYCYINVFIPFLFHLAVGLELVIFYIIAFVAIFFALISIIVCLVRKKKMQTNIKSDKFLLLTIIFSIIPIITFLPIYAKEKYLINHSDLVLVFDSGEMFDSRNFAYAINNKYCKEISIGADFGGYDMEKHLSGSVTEFDTFQDENYKIIINHKQSGYKVVVNDFKENSIEVYKEDIKIHNKRLNYSNIDFEKGFYLNK